MPFSRELWIEREDYQDTPPKGYFRLFPGNKVRLKFGYVVECTGYDKATDTVRCKYLPETKSGTPGADSVKVKGVIHWVSAKHAHAADVHLYDRLFKTEKPEGEQDLNPNSKKTIRGQLEPSLKEARKEAVQFERHGYYVSDASTFIRTATLRDSWSSTSNLN